MTIYLAMVEWAQETRLLIDFYKHLKCTFGITCLDFFNDFF